MKFKLQTCGHNYDVDQMEKLKKLGFKFNKEGKVLNSPIIEINTVDELMQIIDNSERRAAIIYRESELMEGYISEAGYVVNTEFPILKIYDDYNE